MQRVTVSNRVSLPATPPGTGAASPGNSLHGQAGQLRTEFKKGKKHLCSLWFNLFGSGLSGLGQ